MLRELFRRFLATGYGVPLVLIVLVCCVTPLLAHVLHVPPLAQQILDRDGLEYDRIAHSLLAGNGYSFDGVNATTMRPPLYPVFLALVYATVGLAGLLPIQIGLGAVAAILTYRLARRLGGERVGVLAGLGAALYPPLQLQAAYVMSDMLYTVFLLAALLLLIDRPDNPTWRRFALIGFLMGLAALTRPTILFLPLLLCLLAVRGPRLPRRNLAMLLLTFGLVLAPWISRNIAVTGRPVLVASLGGFNLWQATYYANIYHNNDGMTRDAEFGRAFEQLRGNDYFLDYQAEPRFQAAALARIKAAPLTYLRYCVLRTLHVWSAFPGTREWAESKPWLYRMLSLCHLAFLGLGLLGLRRLDPSLRWVIGLVLLYTLGFHGIMNLLTRYLIPIYPLFIALAAVAVAPWAFRLPRGVPVVATGGKR